MRKLLALALSLPLVACVVGDATDGDGTGGGGGDGTGNGDGTGGGDGVGISGKIVADTTWSGDVAIGGNVTIEPGVTVTIEPGANISVRAGALITVNGTLDAQGTSAGKITISGQNNGLFGGIAVNGELKYSYVTQTGGGITTFGSGKATIVDSHFSRTSGDFLVMSGGTVEMAYSMIGREPGETDTTHCNMHFGGSGNVIKITHSNISTSDYGLMFYGGMGADFTYNNWFSNRIDVDTMPSAPVSGDFSNGWFEKGAPTGAGITAQNLATARLPACNGTNDEICAGPRP